MTCLEIMAKQEVKKNSETWPAGNGAAPRNFIQDIIRNDLSSDRYDGRVHTRFPPEPNGFLHIGHAKSICLNFGIAQQYSGAKCNLRFDDTNPSCENDEYVESIKRDIRWLGFDWEDNLFFTSDYFDQLYEFAVKLITKGKAYVCELTPDETSAYRGTLNKQGINSPYRDRPIEDNIDIFRRMRAGEFSDGSRTLRAKIDMASPNLNMRDPVIYRIMRTEHQRTGNKWRIYPMYDFAHGQSDSIEGITHSICTLEFENHRPLYDWFINELEIYHPQQIEFARLNLNHTVMSKRKLMQLVDGGHVNGWDDPRMPTIAGLRRRGYTPEAIRRFCDRIGVGKTNSTSDIALLEHFIRDDLNRNAMRAMAVLHPLKIVIENYPNDQQEEIDAVNNPEDETMGSRKVPFSRVIYIERDDFMEEPPKKFFRLAPGREVRLRYAYYIKCTGVIKDEESGEITELRCTYDPETRGGYSPDGRKVKATLHWVSANHAVSAEVRLYNHLFEKENPEDDDDIMSSLNANSVQILRDCLVEPGIDNTAPGNRYQFERLGYFCVDPDSADNGLVFNRTVTLKDSWAKIKNH